MALRNCFQGEETPLVQRANCKKSPSRCLFFCHNAGPLYSPGLLRPQFVKEKKGIAVLFQAECVFKESCLLSFYSVFANFLCTVRNRQQVLMSSSVSTTLMQMVPKLYYRTSSDRQRLLFYIDFAPNASPHYFAFENIEGSFSHTAFSAEMMRKSVILNRSLKIPIKQLLPLINKGK